MQTRMRWLLLLALPVAIWGCSHISQTHSAEKAVAVATTNRDLAKAAVIMRVSDFAQEARYTNLQTPPSRERTAIDQILGLLVQLTGPGKLTEAQRQAFAQKLIAGGLAAQKEINNAYDDNADLQKQVAKRDAQLVEANTNLRVVAEHSATVADELDSWLHYALYALILAGLYFLARILISIGVFGARLASKFPL